ncbi:hypothetical protein Ciccas_001278 [Cichlidogyrus casuarinus]|uniref:Uncharacterized protein n=1 Tax=Cichlidogyrus casuarinus TaxID=1844966 RepID=A0ABD2QLM8_9PLAT
MQVSTKVFVVRIKCCLDLLTAPFLAEKYLSGSPNPVLLLIDPLCLSNLEQFIWREKFLKSRGKWIENLIKVANIKSGLIVSVSLTPLKLTSYAQKPWKDKLSTIFRIRREADDGLSYDLIDPKDNIIKYFGTFTGI